MRAGEEEDGRAEWTRWIEAGSGRAARGPTGLTGRRGEGRRGGMKSAWKWLLGIAAGVAVGTGCIRTEPPCVVVRYGGSCVLTMEYEGEEEGRLKCRFDGDNVLWRRYGGPVATRIVLEDVQGKVICSVEGEEFTERYRNAPGKGNQDFAIRLSAEGVRWLSREEFRKEAEESREIRERKREEEDRKKDWLTRELDSRRRSGP